MIAVGQRNHGRKRLNEGGLGRFAMGQPAGCVILVAARLEMGLYLVRTRGGGGEKGEEGTSVFRTKKSVRQRFPFLVPERRGGACFFPSHQEKG